MDKIRVVFNDVFTTKTIKEKIYQWSQGLELIVEGLNLPNFTEFTFSTQESGGTAITRIGFFEDNRTTVKIPDEMFEKLTMTDYKIYAYIHYSDIDSDATKYKIVIPVIARSKPDDFESKNDFELFKKVLEEVNRKYSLMSEGVLKAESFAVGGTGTREGEDTDNAKYYSLLAAEDAVSTREIVKDIAGVQEDVENKTKQVEQNRQIVEETVKNVFETEQRINKTKDDINLLAEDVRQNKQSVEQSQTDVTSKAEQVAKDVQQTAKDVQQTAKDKKAVEDVKTQFTQDVKTATDSITQQTSTSLDAIDTKTAEQLQAVTDKGTEQVKAVEQAGAQFTQELPKLKEDISSKLDKNLGVENTDKVLKVDTEGNVVPVPKAEIAPDGLQEDILKNAVKPIVKGNPIVLKDSSDNKPVNLEISGSTMQGENPSPQSPQPIVNGECDHVSYDGKNLFDISNAPLEQKYFSVTKENNGIRIKGKTPSLSTVYPAIVGVIPLREKTVGKTYTFSIKSITNQFGLVLFFRKKGGKQQSINIKKGQKSETVKINDDYETIDMIMANFPLDTEVDVLIDDIQLELGSQATEYEPYKGQTVTFPKIELSEWDKIKKIDGVWKKEVNTAKEIFDNTNDWILEKMSQCDRFKLTNNGYVSTLTENRNFNYCNRFKQPTNISGAEVDSFFVYGRYIYFVMESNKYTLEEWKQFLKNNPLECLLVREVSTYEILPQETQEVLNSIETFYPNSVIQTNEGIELDLTYIADTKLYIDGKFAELQKELANTQKHLL